MFIRQGSKKLTQSIALTALLIGGGCARYVSLAPADVPVGQDVRLELTPAGATKLAGSIGARARYVQGRLTGNAPNGDMIVAASTLVRDNGSEETLNGIEVTLPTDAIVQVQWRQLDPPRSALPLAATIGGAFVVGRAVSGGAEPSATVAAAAERRNSREW